MESIAEFSGWDGEALFLASHVVEDTPDRNLKNKKRSDLSYLNVTLISSRRKSRAPLTSIPIPILNLDDGEDSVYTNKEEAEKGISDLQLQLQPKKQEEISKDEEEKEKSGCSSSSTLACMDRLREELSCAICLDICYEPSTTPCGHSFCKSCLEFAADKCGKRCPKCRQLIGNGRSYTINTILWNTIQLLFPKEVQSRKEAVAAALNNRIANQPKNSTDKMSSSNDHS